MGTSSLPPYAKAGMSCGVGQRVGEFTLAKRLGSGKFGVVFEGRGASGQKVALKVPRRNAGAIELAAEEAEIMRACETDRPTCPLVHLICTESYKTQKPILVLDYMGGGTLEDAGPLPWREVCELGAMACEGLAWLHDRGWIHADLKPENMLRSSDGRQLRLCDLGNAQRMTSMDVPCSTFYYRSPETLLAHSPYLAPVDVWALGCILYELFTGKVLFSIDDLTEEDEDDDEQYEDEDDDDDDDDDEDDDDDDDEEQDEEEQDCSSSSSSSSDDDETRYNEQLAQLAQLQAYFGVFPKTWRTRHRRHFNARGLLFAADPPPPYGDLQAKLDVEAAGRGRPASFGTVLQRAFRYKDRMPLSELHALLDAEKSTPELSAEEIVLRGR